VLALNYPGSGMAYGRAFREAPGARERREGRSGRARGGKYLQAPQRFVGRKSIRTVGGSYGGLSDGPGLGRNLTICFLQAWTFTVCMLADGQLGGGCTA